MHNNPSNMISFRGEVVGFYEKDGNHSIILYCNSCFRNIALKDVSDIYLGDKIIVNPDLSIKKIKTQTRENRLNVNHYNN
jgi:hypothetical protein